MKILKLIKNANYDFYYVVFDEVPELTYEKIGLDYIGSAIDSDGAIIASNFLKYESFGNAFGGREITLKMKDGSTQKIKDYWYDWGWCKEHGEFINIGAGTVEELQRCYVYYGYNINKQKFEEMMEEYFTRDKLYEYREVEEWCKLQHKWYDVIVHGKKIPFMMNKYGEMVEKETKKRVYPRYNLCKKVNGKYKMYTYFRFQYKDDSGRLIKIDANYLDVLKATLPFSEEEIIKNCELNIL
jgi:hypothetical protein